ncbi:MAG: hypothetical protein IKI31_00140 [Treponema sp.]|nr:hypothetical protein [Treponema sp.]
MKKFFTLVLIALYFVSCATTKSASTKKSDTQTKTLPKESLSDLEEAVEDALSPNATRLPSSSLSEPNVKDSENASDDKSNESSSSSRNSIASPNAPSQNETNSTSEQNASSERIASQNTPSQNTTSQNAQAGSSAKSYPESSRLSENSNNNIQVQDSSRTQNTSPRSQTPPTSQSRNNTPSSSSIRNQTSSTPPRQSEKSNTNVSRMQDSSRTRGQDSSRTQNANTIIENDSIKNEPELNFSNGDVFFEEEETNEISPENIIPSRTITLDKNQYLDVAYPGTGWIYLGETTNEKHLVFFGRKLGDVDTSFTLRATKSGTAILHFYKNDVLTGKFIDDYLEVVIRDKVASSSEHVKAPSYALVVPPSPSSAQDESEITPLPTVENATTTTASNTPQTSPSANLQTEPKTAITTQTATPNEKSATKELQTNALSADDLLERAKKAYNDKQYENAKSLLDLFFQKSTTRIDEGLYLQGQVLEERSSVQNIKNAIASYDTLLKDFPESNLWKNAERRSIYLKRMYIDIR